MPYTPYPYMVMAERRFVPWVSSSSFVVVAGVLAAGFLWWFFFGPKRARRAEVIGGVQEVHVTVKGGYSPDVIRVRQGVPLRLVFDRQETGECTSRVVFPDFEASRALPAFATTTLDLMPDEVGEFGFACGMNMVHGTLVVEPAGSEQAPATRRDTTPPTRRNDRRRRPRDRPSRPVAGNRTR